MLAVAWVLGLFGLLAMLLALSRLLIGQRLAAWGHAALAATLLAMGVTTALVAADLGSYQPRAGERPVADVYFEQVATRRYRVTLTRLPGGRMQVFELAGDAWRIDARTIDFGGWAQAMGGRPGYRLDRLVAVERVAGSEEWAPTTGFALDARDGLDLWEWSRRTGRWHELLTAGHARSDELPMAGPSRFELWIVGERIDVRPEQAVAEAAEPAEP
jgi:hypothetical protein